MSDDPRELERQLEQATARSGPSGAPLDPETASLREAWLALGQLLETAHPATDLPVQPRAAPRARRRPRWLVPAAVALAASLLIGVTVVWTVRGLGPSSDASSGGMALEGASPSASIAQRPSRALPEAKLAWHDTLDNEIVLAGQAVVSAQEDWPILADASNSVQYGLQQVEKDVQGSPL